MPRTSAELTELFHANIGTVMEKLGGWVIPLIWTADFMLDYDEDGKDKYVLGEISCSCVGFTSHLDRGIQDQVADQVVNVIETQNT